MSSNLPFGIGNEYCKAISRKDQPCGINFNLTDGYCEFHSTPFFKVKYPKGTIFPIRIVSGCETKDYYQIHFKDDMSPYIISNNIQSKGKAIGNSDGNIKVASRARFNLSTENDGPISVSINEILESSIGTASLNDEKVVLEYS